MFICQQPTTDFKQRVFCLGPLLLSRWWKHQCQLSSPMCSFSWCRCRISSLWGSTQQTRKTWRLLVWETCWPMYCAWPHAWVSTARSKRLSLSHLAQTQNTCAVSNLTWAELSSRSCSCLWQLFCTSQIPFLSPVRKTQQSPKFQEIISYGVYLESSLTFNLTRGRGTCNRWCTLRSVLGFKHSLVCCIRAGATF